MSRSPKVRRRTFLKAAAATSAAVAAPMIVPSTVLGANPPSERITVGMIGYGRQARHVNVAQLLKSPNAQVVAVCDVDAWRADQGKQLIEKYYGEQAGATYTGCSVYEDFRELLTRDDIDAVMSSTPDHWHVPVGLAAAKAGKHISSEKPLTTAIAHGRLLCDTVEKCGVISRTDSEFRSLPAFWKAAERVRNGYIGKLERIEVVSPGDSRPVGTPDPMPVPDELNYDLWLGPAFEKPYTLHRVHPPRNLGGRPGWLRVSDYTNGMIANWGSHLNDVAQWGHDTDRTGPVKVVGTGSFSKGLWDTITKFKVRYEFADDVVHTYTMGGEPTVKWIGSDGWIKVEYPKTIEASDPAILETPLEEGEEDLSGTLSDKEDWLRAIKTGEEPLNPFEAGHRTNSIAQIGLIAIQTGKELAWDPVAERFTNDDSANGLLDRPVRGDWLKV
ncbi:MAG: Gfo/Idh/MocA family oxidoreductase [bacterium]|nr:Gfo/Idh/MocA family oxidoreductase [bacterium]